jgi:O-antigen/teichoic acid export membrane protein
MLILIGRMLQFVLTIVSMKLMTTLLSPEEMGNVALVGTATALFALAFVNPVGMFINRRLHSWERHGLFLPYFRHFLLYLAVVAVVSAVLSVVLGATGIVPVNAWALIFAALVAGSLLFNTPNQTLIPALNMLGHQGSFVILTIGALVLSSGLAIAFVLIWKATAVAWLCGVLLGQLLFSFLSYAVVRSFLSPQTRDAPLDRKKVDGLFKFAFPLSIAVGLNWAHMQSYRFLLVDGIGLREFGLFMAGYGVGASLIGAMEVVLATYFQPRFYRDSNADDPGVRAAAWVTYANAMIPLATLGSLATVAAASYLASIMLGPEFQVASSYISFGVIAEWSRFVFGTVVLKAHARMQTRDVIGPSLVGAVLSVGGIFLTLDTFGVAVVPVFVVTGAILASLAFMLKSAYQRDLGELRWRDFMKSAIFGLLLIPIPRIVDSHLAGFGSLKPLVGLAGLGAVVLAFTWFLLDRDLRRRLTASGERMS